MNADNVKTCHVKNLRSCDSPVPDICIETTSLDIKDLVRLIYRLWSLCRIGRGSVSEAETKINCMNSKRLGMKADRSFT